MEIPPPKPFAELTAAERRQLLRRRIQTTRGSAMEIGGQSAARRLARIGGRVLALLAVAGLFVVLFFRFTASWRVALIVVTVMLAYMLVVGRLVEGKAERLD